jgi:hypothetical protein
MTKKTTLNELGEMLAFVVKRMATKDDIADVRRDMATKDDINRLGGLTLCELTDVRR